MFSGLGLAPLILIFGVAAGAVWFAGIHLSRSTDVLDTRLGLGEALGGAILLAIAVSRILIAHILGQMVSSRMSIFGGFGFAASSSATTSSP